MDEKKKVGETVLVIKTPDVTPKELLECLDEIPEAKHFTFFLEGLKKTEPAKISEYGQQMIWSILNM